MNDTEDRFKLIDRFISQFKENHGDKMLIDITGFRGGNIKVQVPDWMSQPAITTFKSTNQTLTEGSTIIFGELPSFEVWFNHSVEPAPLPEYMELFT